MCLKRRLSKNYKEKVKINLQRNCLIFQIKLPRDGLNAVKINQSCVFVFWHKIQNKNVLWNQNSSVRYRCLFICSFPSCLRLSHKWKHFFSDILLLNVNSDRLVNNASGSFTAKSKHMALSLLEKVSMLKNKLCAAWVRALWAEYGWISSIMYGDKKHKEKILKHFSNTASKWDNRRRRKLKGIFESHFLCQKILIS